MTAVADAATDRLGGYVVDRQVGFLLRRAHQRHVALFNEAMAPLDLTPTQFTALVKITEHGRVSQNELGRQAGMDPATIQGVVQRLIARGLVRRAADPNDRRVVMLAPTQAGLDLIPRATDIATGVTAATLAPLAPQDRERFLVLLQQLV